MIISTLELILIEHVGDTAVIACYSIGVVTLTGLVLGVPLCLDGTANPILGTIADRIGNGDHPDTRQHRASISGHKRAQSTPFQKRRLAEILAGPSLSMTYGLGFEPR